MSFVTSTGTIYTIRNGRIRRDSGIFSPVVPSIEGWPCVRYMSPIQVDECVRMFIDGRGWLHTTPVQVIYA